MQQEVDEGHLKAVDVVLELEDLMGQLDFLRVGYDEVIALFIQLFNSFFFCLFFLFLLRKVRASLIKETAIKQEA